MEHLDSDRMLLRTGMSALWAQELRVRYQHG